MSRAAKTLAKMKANPRERRVDDMKTLAIAFGLMIRETGSSHVVFRHNNGSMLTVPARRPIKAVYVVKFVRLIEEGLAE